ncbi:MAG: putative Zn-dependent protease [Halioglobus sp.]|jgi:predicted Zn-dependent protease
MSTQPRGNPKIPEGINSSQEHPLKEFAQLLIGVTLSIVLATATLTFAIGFAARFIPYSWEREVASGMNPEAFLYDTDESPSPTQQQALQALGQEIISSLATLPDNQTGADSNIASVDYQFHLVASEDPNAFATLGGHIIVTQGLLEEITSENALAMVLAHEIAHVQYRHPVQAASRGVIVQLLLLAVTGASTGSIFGGALDMASLYTMLNFNREMELDADRQALRLLGHHYGHLEGADEFFRKIAEDGDISWLEFTQTHPSTDKRLEVIQAAMAQTQLQAGSTSRLIPMETRFRP